MFRYILNVFIEVTLIIMFINKYQWHFGVSDVGCSGLGLDVEKKGIYLFLVVCAHQYIL